MLSITHFGEGHTLTIKQADDSAIVVEVDGAPAFKILTHMPAAECRIWFRTHHADASCVLLRFRRQYQTIDRLDVRVNPDEETLQRMGLAKITGCDHWYDVRELSMVDGRAPWRDFTDDIGLFISHGCRFSLGWMVTAMITYGVSMAIAVSMLKAPTAGQTSIMGLVWLISLGLFVSAAVGQQHRILKAPPERRGWLSLWRVTKGLAVGSALCAWVGISMRWY